MRRFLKRLWPKRKPTTKPEDVYRVEIDGIIYTFDRTPKTAPNRHNSEYVQFLTDIEER